MSWRIAVYGAVGAALAVLSLGTVGWAMSVAEPVPNQAVAVEEPEAAPLPVAPVIPADAVVKGSAPAIAAKLDLASDASLPQGNQIKICDVEVNGWVRSESIRLSDAGVGLSIQVAAWRAGAAASAFDQLEKGAQGCAEVSTSEAADEFRARVSSADGTWASGVRRVGDLLIATSASSGSTDPAQWVDRVLAAGQEVLKPRLATTCVDPTSARSNDHVARDPYSGQYTGFRVASPRKLEDSSVLTKAQIATIKEKQPESNWRAPNAVADPALAPIIVAPQSPPAPIGADPATATRGPAPQLIPIDKFVPPNTAEPSSDELKEPVVPAVGDGVMVAMVPAVDNSGPGCGWDFVGTVNPETTEAEMAEGARKAVIDALLKDTALQSQRMLDTLSWPTAYNTWVTKASIAKSWDSYRYELDAAKTKLAAAKRKYDDSLLQWREGTLTPVVPVPDPAASGAVPPSSGVPGTDSGVTP